MKTPPWTCARWSAWCSPQAPRKPSPTGIAIELPRGHEAQVRPRSGLALKHSITVNFGTIDPGYRGEIRVVMFNLGRADYVSKRATASRSSSWRLRRRGMGGGRRSDRFGARGGRLRIVGQITPKRKGYRGP
jgi:hypothetical protein